MVANFPSLGSDKTSHFEISDVTKRLPVSVQETQSMPMPKELWTKLYAMRNGRLEIIMDLSNPEGIKRCIADCRKTGSTHSDNYILNSELNYLNASGNWNSTPMGSWGDVIEFAVLRKIDLNGLTLSEEQKKYSYKTLLQKRNLRNAQLDYASFVDMDLSGINLQGASMNFVKLNSTTGVRPNFTDVNGQQIDFSGAKYVEPNFYDMKAIKSNHFCSSYEQAIFRNTDWNSSRFVGTQFFLKNPSNGSFGLDLSNSVAAACLFFGTGIEKVAPQFRFNQAAFPGSCFHNLTLHAGSSYMQKADFSPLVLDDPRLTEDETAYVATFGQWLGSKQSVDGIKVSSETELPQLDKHRIYSMFSETTFTPYYKNDNTVLFSKREVLSRTSFHECAMVDLNTILPEALRIVAPVAQEQPVLQEVVAEAVQEDPKNDFLQVPQVTLDHAKLEEQIEGLKTASISSATALGMDLQAIFSKASTFVSQWAIAGSGHQSAFSTHLKDLTDRIAAYDINEQAPPPPEPEPEPVAPPRKKGIMERFGIAIGAIADVDDIPVAVAKPVFEPFKENEEKFAHIRQDIDALQGVVTAAIEKSAQKLTNIEELVNYLDTLKQAMAAYNEGIDRVVPELEMEKGAGSAVVRATAIRRSSLGQSEKMLSVLKDNVAAMLDIEIEKGASIQWVQGVVLPTLNTQFTSASGLYDLATSLRKGDEAYKKNKILSGLYNVSAQKASDGRVDDQVKQAFGNAKEAIVNALLQVVPVLEAVETKKAAALEAILQPN